MPRCTANTTRGTRCRRKASGAFCYQHTAKTREVVPVTQDMLYRMHIRINRAIIDEAQTRIAEAQRQIEIYEALLAPPTLRDFIADGQNVHTRVTRNGLLPLYDAINKFYNEQLMERGDPLNLVTMTKVAITTASHFTEYVLRNNLVPFWERVGLRILRPLGITPPGIVRNISKEIREARDTIVFTRPDPLGHPAPVPFWVVFIQGIVIAFWLNNQELWTRLCQEAWDSRNVCVQGKAMRLINAFSGFEHLIGAQQVDPRSQAERLGDLFSALRRRELPDADARAEAERILDAENVRGVEARAVWLEAL